MAMLLITGYLTSEIRHIAALPNGGTHNTTAGCIVKRGSCELFIRSKWDS